MPRSQLGSSEVESVPTTRTRVDNAESERETFTTTFTIATVSSFTAAGDSNVSLTLRVPDLSHGYHCHH